MAEARFGEEFPVTLTLAALHERCYEWKLVHRESVTQTAKQAAWSSSVSTCASLAQNVLRSLLNHNLNMPLTKVEELLFGGNRAHFVKAFEFANGAITMRITPVERNPEAISEETTATFSNASVPDIWKDPSEADELPLDIIGFDCYPHGKRWKFT